MRVFCATMTGVQSAYGYYTLSIIAPKADTLHPDITFGQSDKHIPFINLDFLAVRTEFQNGKIGTLLLGHALDACDLVANHVGLYGVSLTALTERAASLYYRYNFRAVPDANPRRPFMVLPTKGLLELKPKAAAEAFGTWIASLNLSFSV